MTTAPKYLEPQRLAKLHGLKLRAQHIVEGFVAGSHRSPYHGFSIEFAEHREYAPGDDLRYVDWKVYGRTDKFYLKQYEDETNLICNLVLDTSESMLYQGPDAALSKLEYAQCLAVTLAWLVQQQQDSVGLVTFDDKVNTLINPASSAAQLMQIIDVMESTNSAGKTATGPIFHELSERLKKRGVVIIISDFFDDVDSMIAGLKHFKHRRHDVILMQVLDPAELEFPFSKSTMFKGMESMPELLADPNSLRKAYLEEMNASIESLRSQAQGLQMDYLLVRTDESLDVILNSFLSSRMARIH
ncbi:MAG: DUF58 domain-containing protein [Blastopirellula sp.]|nr:MAG: DUF58 domain-containing protein [Blastopirellula sp.]